MPLQVLGPGEVFEARATLDHRLDRVTDNTALLVSLQMFRPAEVLGA